MVISLRSAVGMAAMWLTVATAEHASCPHPIPGAESYT